MTDERLNLTEFDFELQNEGSIVVLHPQNDAAREWIDEHLYTEQTQWWGGGIVIEPRYVEDILDGITDVGLTIKPPVTADAIAAAAEAQPVDPDPLPAEFNDRPCGCPADYHMADCPILTDR